MLQNYRHTTKNVHHAYMFSDVAAYRVEVLAIAGLMTAATIVPVDAISGEAIAVANVWDSFRSGAKLPKYTMKTSDYPQKICGQL